MEKTQTLDWREREREALTSVLDLEKLAVKKAGIYSKILTEQALAEDFESLAERHTESCGKLERVLFGKKDKSEEGSQNED